jgi:hemolysin III
MLHLELREPASAWSHGIGMVLALGLAGHFHRLWRATARGRASRYEQGKGLTLSIFGLCLVVCYGSSALYHGAWTDDNVLEHLSKLDHVGIYVLIAGSYTPAAWALFRRTWRRYTLAIVWSVATCCGLVVWLRGVLPAWLSTATYLAMGWGVLFCYHELARTQSHRTLLPLPLGGVCYSVGAMINLAGWPVVVPGVFGAHELFHLFVIAGSACHVGFMLAVVVPAQPPADWESIPLTECTDPALAYPQGASGQLARLVRHTGGTLWAPPYLATPKPSATEPQA